MSAAIQFTQMVRFRTKHGVQALPRLAASPPINCADAARSALEQPPKVGDLVLVRSRR